MHDRLECVKIIQYVCCERAPNDPNTRQWSDTTNGFLYYSPMITSTSFMSVPLAEADDVKISAPAASESISSASLEGPKFGSFRISSRSSLNPSARDDIQNFLNLSFIACSRAPSSVDGFGGRKDGISALGREGEGDLGRGASFS